MEWPKDKYVWEVLSPGTILRCERRPYTLRICSEEEWLRAWPDYSLRMLRGRLAGFANDYDDGRPRHGYWDFQEAALEALKARMTYDGWLTSLCEETVK